MSLWLHADIRRNICAHVLFTIGEYESAYVAQELSYLDQNLTWQRIVLHDNRKIREKGLKIDIIGAISFTVDIVGVDTCNRGNTSQKLL